jgi:hypothetical protein
MAALLVGRTGGSGVIEVLAQSGGTGVDAPLLAAVGGLITVLGGAVVWGWKAAEKRASDLQNIVIEKVFPTITELTTKNAALTDAVKELIGVLRDDIRGTRGTRGVGTGRGRQ